jgi:hypothetical protein
MEAYRTSLANTGTTMVLSPDSEFFRYFGSKGSIPAGNPNPAAPIQPTAAPITAPASNEPALDGLGIEESTVPSITDTPVQCCVRATAFSGFAVADEGVSVVPLQMALYSSLR